MAEEHRNIGTQNHPVSWLHERTIALLYDALINSVSRGGSEVQARLEPGGEMSHNLVLGVDIVKVPDPEWDSIGGIVPDLILYGPDSKPVRVVEVVVTAPPDEKKAAKLEALRRRGVDVVLVTVRTAEDALNLLGSVAAPKFRGVGNIRRRVVGADKAVLDLVGSILNCSPDTRLELFAAIKNLPTLDSLYPVEPDNPLAEKLREDETNRRECELTWDS